MPNPLFTNNANTILASNITSGQTTIPLNAGTGALFPNPTSPDFFFLTVISASNPAQFEIMRCMARSTDTCTVVRAQEGTTAQAFNASDIVALLPTAAGYNAMRNQVSQPTSTGSANAQVVANAVPLLVLGNGSRQVFIPGFNNSGDTTLTVDATAATHIYAFGDTLKANMLVAGIPAAVQHDGTNWQLENPQNDYGIFNPDINGDCRDNQRPNATISTSFQNAGPDRFSAAVTTGATSAGTIQQAVTSLLGTSGYALQLAGCTITGSGVVTARYRIESKDVQQFVNQNGVVSVHVYHDVGSTINYTIQVNKANSQDNFGGGVTQIAISGNQAVATATDTVISLQLPMGACGNGVEIKIAAACGAVTTKNFYFTELQLRLGFNVRKYPFRTLSQEKADCRYYYQVFGDGVQGYCGSTTVVRIGYEFGPQMRVAPVMSLLATAITGNTGAGAVTSSGSIISTSTSVTADGFNIVINGFTGLTSPNPFIASTSNWLAADAELT